MDPDKQLEVWMERYIARLLRLAYVYVKDWAAAEDRVQDALIKAYRSRNQLINTENPFPWLAKIVITECKTSQRRNWREIVTAFLPDRIVVSAEEIYLGSMDSKQIHDAILSLPERLRVPVVLFYFDGISVKEIAEVTSVRSGTVKSRLSRGRDQLRLFLKEDDEYVPGQQDKNSEPSF